jgi:hypothetical protein
MTHLDFVKAWLELRDTRLVADRFGWDTRKVANIAAGMRRKGVLLPALNRGRPPQAYTPSFTDCCDVPALNKFILER